MLFHANGRPIVGRVPDQKEVVSRGSQIRFPTFMALIISCVISPYGSIRFPPDSSVFNKAGDSQTSEKIRGLHWKVRFRGHSNQQSVLFNHGIVLIRPDAKRLVLQNSDEVTVDARSLLMDEEILVGSRVDFACHRAFVDVCVDQTEMVEAVPNQIVSIPSLNFLRGDAFAKLVRHNWDLPEIGRAHV